MATVSLKKHVQQLIITSQIGKALDVLLNWAEQNDNELYNKIILLSARYNGLKDEITGELIDDSNARTNKARIANALNTYLNDDVQDDALIEVAEKAKPVPPVTPISIQPTLAQPIVEHKNPTIVPSNALRILMLTANPANSVELNLLDKEHSQIAQKLQGKYDKFALQIQKAVNRTEFKELTESLKPDVLHFSGHGTRGEDGNGIVLQNDNKNGYEIITTQRLDILFEYFKGLFPLKAVFLNACYSAEQAKVIAKYVPYVIGTTKEIEDEYAASFSVGFYFKLVESGGDFERAYTSGRTEAALAGAAKKDFVLYKNGKKVNIK